MKTLVISILIALTASASYSQQEQYQTAMLEYIVALDNAERTEDFQTLANNFDRISSAEKEQWLPSYYSAYCYIMIAFMTGEGEKIDQYLDMAQKRLDNASESAGNNSELLVIQAMLYQARINVDFMNRGMKYSSKARAALEKAKAIDPENPRIYYLMGENIYHTPPFAGGGPEAAITYFEEGKTKFNSFVAETELHPDWGKEDNNRLLKQCNEQLRNN